ncbi:restriction endonuclease subunit S [Vibrio cholerae]|nr:restriction endonuclease subunit S [Vibrio cholerae]
MAGRYKAYLEYKQPDIKFVNDIPTHWVISKVRHISTFGRGLPITKANLQDTGIPCVSYGEVHSKFGFEVDPSKHALKCVSEEYLASSPYALLSKGDFVFADTSEDIDGSGNFTQLVSDETLFAGYHTVIVRPSPANYYRFVAYLFDSPEFRTQVRDAAKGVKVFSVTQAILKNASVWLPSFEEQQKIANFLDHETAKIDTLIAKQEKLIELLKEKRQAVISHAVTKGLNPNAPMKDSGVEWLGEVPEHWSLCSIKYLCREITDGAHISPDLKEGVHHFVSIKDIKNGEINFDDSLLTSEESYHYLVKTGCMPFEGDILFSKDGTIGQTAITPPNKDFVVASSLIIIRPNLEKVSSEYLDLMLQSSLVKEQVESFVKGAALRRLSIQNLLKVFGLRPPLNEQKKIAEHVNLQLSKFSALEDKAQKQVQLLQERKTALISAAVTGKIDVRHFVTEQGQPQGAQG